MTNSSDFLYPFLDDAAEPADASALLEDLARSAEAKWRESEELSSSVLERESSHLSALGAELARRAGAGGRVFTVGNGGSATDAMDLAAELPVPALCLAADPAVFSALANDVGIGNAFTRQLAALARPNDTVIGFSTSGDSENVVAVLQEADRQGLLTIGFAGYDGGSMGRLGLEHVMVVPSQSVHRVQEAQCALSAALCRSVAEALVA